ncbi:MAG: DNA-processing protein DprA [Phycisphaerae bacterium]
MRPTITDTGRIHLRWALIDGVGPLLFSRLLVQFGDAEAALGASAQQLAEIRRIGQQSSEQIARARDAVEIGAEIEAAAQHGVRIVCREDEDYLPGLRQIADAPIVLYVKGELQPADAVAIAIVGTRRCTIYGSEQARRFGELLAGAGFTIVSGLARGIDAFAHHGAVDAGGRAIAVMGKGLLEVYPLENKALAERLLENGAWISELPMQAEVRRENFPGRNRIIAGMTLGTLVVEAPEHSGALITARLANEYNREVFAVPGRAQDPAAFGTNDLIRRGYAKLTTCLEDVLEELGEVGEKMWPTPATATSENVAAAAGGSKDSPAARPRPAPSLSETEKRVYEVIGYEPILQDAVLTASQLPPGEVLAAFTSLELKGLIKRLPGQLVVRTGSA